MASVPRAPTGPGGDRSGRARYRLASGHRNVLAAVATRLLADDRVTVLGAPPGGPLTIATVPHYADALRAEYAGALVVEREGDRMTEQNGPANHRDEPDRQPGAEGAEPAGDDRPGTRPVGTRQERYLVAPLVDPRSPADPGDPDQLVDQLVAHLEGDPSAAVRRVVRPGRGGTGRVFPPVAVVEMAADRAAALARTPLWHVEPDLLLQHATPGPLAGLAAVDPGVVPMGEDATLAFEVRGDDGEPLEAAEVYLVGTVFPVRGVTGADGRAQVRIPTGAVDAVHGVYVKPRQGHWSVWSARPDLARDTVNLLVCPALGATLPGFPGRELDGWARRAMRFDALPPIFRGHGIKIAIIDSGAAVAHPDLADRFAGGRDVVGHDDRSWTVDTLGHGSHSAGVIGARDNGSGVVGVAPEAELHACRIFPGGRFSDLLEALDYCIDAGVDVVALGLGSPQGSALVAYKIEQARQAGVACVAAVGNSGGPVCFPATLPSVLAVAAIGKVDTFPDGSYHATQVLGTPTAAGYFPARFSCSGPQVDVCAPGVAIVSCVPPQHYAAWDGTAFAASYVAGLAALVLAHHPDFRAQFTARDAGRVDRLFDIIRRSSRPLALGDPGREGAGLPDAVLALGLESPVSTAPPSDPRLAALWLAMAQAGLLPVPVPVAPPGPAAVAWPVSGPVGPVPGAGVVPGAGLVAGVPGSLLGGVGAVGALGGVGAVGALGG
ncbi:MAG TPA: S8 family serine peptidase, partial [Pilimelia sp.]|nr:S8 family serine peptidase [Pilimelia sp.]